ncbi:folate-binding protein YgfZ [Cupriavidus sp. AU9028]|uniref:CAF17-like 4Fe-4S cluster assembly/insertion protein YgfZ n=1 Tax=Cupriavidus sp. AU9028 TaxID=2871157 RepID=UPI001C98028C|nr:folate-binding protein YgfZ [Cupriavidus sp. AU9028]MBY4897471.1 folate-binding protein YgfZ [Cupriavidus sp. AU9028]
MHAPNPARAAQFAALRQDGVVCRPANLGLIRVEGDDAATFLHSQLTNAVDDLAPGQARLAGYCSPKGRLLATFLMWRDAAGIALQLSADLQPAIQKRLSMFVLRAKAKLSDLGAASGCVGVAGARGDSALSAAGLLLPAGPWSTASEGDTTVLRLPDTDGVPRWQVWGPAERIDALRERLAVTLLPADAELWDWLDIRSGLPRIVVATQERFVPQMVNFELIGGVNFRKGCYPGQEIVARSQYRGTLKRRMWLVAGEGETPAEGTEIFRTDEPEQPAGMIVNAAPGPDGGWEALAELKIDAASAALRLGHADGLALTLGELPYAVPLLATDPAA